MSTAHATHSINFRNILLYEGSTKGLSGLDFNCSFTHFSILFSMHASHFPLHDNGNYRILPCQLKNLRVTHSQFRSARWNETDES
jgi:hypothetical protein